MNDIQWWVWLIIAAAVIALVTIAVTVGRTRTDSARRAKAADLREEAETTQADVSRHKAEAMAARANAEETHAQAEELERRAEQHDQQVEATRDHSRERLAEADRIDPDVDDETDRHDEADGHDEASHMSGSHDGIRDARVIDTDEAVSVDRDGIRDDR